MVRIHRRHSAARLDSKCLRALLAIRSLRFITIEKEQTFVALSKSFFIDQ
jgi:hypothetical protein